MGKRKERRLAATAGRRVKLDLFAEPSGDLGGSSDQDEVIGGDDDSKSRAGLTSSPSSSGQQPENPLLLLGQYSDDELDEESSRSLNNAIVENFLADLDDQAKVTAGKESEQNNIFNLAAEKVQHHDVENVSASPDSLQLVEGNGVGENDATELVDLQREVDTTEPVSVSTTSDVHVGGDLTSGWKLVFHEESNQYYYWNTVTGETSWDVPPGLVLHKTDDTAAAEGENNAVLGMEVEPGDILASLPVDGTRAENPNCETKEMSQHGFETEVGNGHACDVSDSEKGGLDFDHGDVKMSYSPSSQPYHKSSPAKKQSDDALLVNGEDETGSNFSSSIVKHGEYLLEKLLSFKSFKGHLQGKEQISKHILEVELRLHDIKSLSSYGSTLLPFWLHSERQLKQLEATINELMQSFELEKTGKVESTQERQQNSGDDIRADTTEKKRICSTSEDSQPWDHDVEASEVQKDSHNEDDNNGAAHANHSSSVEYSNPLAVQKSEVVAELSSATAIQPEEDMDMDVEMEVEEEIPARNTITGDQLGALDSSCPPDHPFSPHPPPPDDDWIPPPPPDNENFPPPPPDEPPEFTFLPQPSEPETVQPLSYAHQYNLTYPVPSFEFYAQTSTVPGSGFYSVSDSRQLAAPLPQIYYGGVPNTYQPGVVTTVINPVETLSYYGTQDGAVLPLPMVSTAESSGHVGQSNIEVGSTSLPQAKADDTSGGAGGETGKAYVSVEAPATISVVQGPSLSSTPAVTTTATAVVVTETVPKVQSKARTKKKPAAVVSSLRSNKKVSSLVDKWKAAKDELHEEDEEDEPENAYEMLEKKRRREIEEWRAQQIASGEAKDNANFQPLGGDWRERVKRRRAQMMKEAVEESLLSSEEGVGDAKQQQPPPSEVNEVSRGLPSGWQAYWDESSKQFYYANSVTSETTWIRPTS